MVRIKIVKDFDMHRVGQVKQVTPNEAHGLIDRGVAILSKDITAPEIVIKKAPTPKPKKIKRVRKYRK